MIRYGAQDFLPPAGLLLLQRVGVGVAGHQKFVCLIFFVCHGVGPVKKIQQLRVESGDADRLPFRDDPAGFR